jgi:hypothetical protein
MTASGAYFTVVDTEWSRFRVTFIDELGRADVLDCIGAVRT